MVSMRSSVRGAIEAGDHGAGGGEERCTRMHRVSTDLWSHSERLSLVEGLTAHAVRQPILRND